ncbi:MAG: 30S ribosomal protein S12 methylthiotransferase RimO [Prevotella sp.]|nr:30S ribosomal protein S12 methylthiotransferase RimO [Prevotella sp.]
MKKGEVDIISMGCSKNLVDSEAVARMLLQCGYTVRFEPENPCGEYAIVNTCGFIQDAKQESIDTILALGELKKRGKIGHLIVMGCLSQRYSAKLKALLPEVDALYGKFNFRAIARDLPDISQGTAAKKPGSWRMTPKHYAYVKISEGCDRHCAFCAIPLITGRHISRPMLKILTEVRALAAEGVREIQLIAQDLTGYGVDIDGKRHIAGLVSTLSDVPGIDMIRLHYAYPNQFPLELLDVIRERPNVCKYLDIAFQHINDRILSAMRRRFTRRETLDLIGEMRRRVPGIHIRTTLMVGFPGETEEEFEELVDFVKTVRFERMGEFMYSAEEGTYAAKHYADDVPAEVKRSRLERLMAVQQKISEEIAAAKVGRVFPVIIDGREGDRYVGRTEYSSPEVDPEVLVRATSRLMRGKIYNVMIESNTEFDLYGSVVR